MTKIRSRQSSPFGDLNAPRDSPAYAVAIKSKAQAALNSVQSDSKQLETWIDILQRDKLYRRLDNAEGHPFWSWEQFCTAEQPHGLGYSPAALTALIHERRTSAALAADPNIAPLAMHGANQYGGAQKAAAPPTRARGRANGNSSGSNQATYIIRRLKRDFPEVAERLAAGEFKSARAAGLSVGIVKPPPPLRVLQLAWEKAPKDAQAAFLEWIQTKKQEGERARA